MSVLAVVGLAKEAGIATKNGLVPVIGTGDLKVLAHRLGEAPAARAVVSFGIAGSLAPLLKVGDAVIATHVVTDDEHHVCDAGWSRILRTKLPHAVSGVVAGSDTIVSHLGMKKSLFRNTGAAAVDMESHVAARFAKHNGLPFVALRVISDGFDRTLPSAALVPLKSSGKPRLLSVLWSILGEPSQIPDLIQTGHEAGLAFRSLQRCCDLLGARLGCPYLD